MADSRAPFQAAAGLLAAPAASAKCKADGLMMNFPAARAAIRGTWLLPESLVSCRAALAFLTKPQSRPHPSDTLRGILFLILMLPHLLVLLVGQAALCAAFGMKRTVSFVQRSIPWLRHRFTNAALA